MHELSLAESMVRELNEYIEREKVNKIFTVTVQMGYFSGVEKEPFEFAYPIVTEGTKMEGSKLIVEQLPGIVLCSECSKTTQLDIPLVKCGSCGSRDVTFTQGREFLIKSMEIE
ncbi:MAG: hydrogenase maturation nickel metallochaperone HypA [bacterium]|nr:hydrogenase maturation nickel metallochaperone HypA [bacterium]